MLGPGRGRPAARPGRGARGRRRGTRPARRGRRRGGGRGSDRAGGRRPRRPRAGRAARRGSGGGRGRRPGGGGGPGDVEAVGVVDSAGSRLAAPRPTSTCWPAGTVTPSSSTGSVVTRNVAWGTGGREPQQLLDGAGEQVRVLAQRGELVGVVEQGDDAVADQAAGGVVAGDDELEQRRQRLGLGRLAAVDGVDEDGDEVARRVRRGVGDEVPQRAGDDVGRGDGLGRRRRRPRAQQRRRTRRGGSAGGRRRRRAARR